MKRLGFAVSLIMLSGLAYADWTSQFIGQITFKLMDDPTYANRVSRLNQIGADYNRAREITVERKRHLDQVAANFHAKNAELKKAETSLQSKIQEKANAESAIPQLMSENHTLEGEISGIQTEIGSTQDDLATANQEFLNLQTQLKNAVAEVAGLKLKLAEAQRACAIVNPGPNPTPRIETKRSEFDSACPEVERIQGLLAMAEATRIQLDSQTGAAGNRVRTLRAEIVSLNATLEKARNQKAQNLQKITTLQATINTISSQIPALQSQVTNLTTQVEQLRQQENSMRVALQTAVLEEERISATFTREQQDFAYFQDDFINQILSYNRLGYDKSLQDGAKDGYDVAVNSGNQAGRTDGHAQGLIDGERTGRDRDYKTGLSQGEHAGSLDGKDKGEYDGRIAGIRNGNREAGRRAGIVAGINRANGADAIPVGERQGQLAGRESAVRDGKNQGTKIGEAEVIEAQESATLNEVTIKGQFAGTFAGSLPSYPGASRRFYNNYVSVSREVLKEAFVSGYHLGYFSAAEKTFYENIQTIYQTAYNNFYNQAYQESLSRVYEDSRKLGYDKQYKISFDREYKVAYDVLYSQFFNATVKQPQTQGDDYKLSYRNAELEAYNDRYEELRSIAYDRVFEQVYNQNIAIETEKYRQERKHQVEVLYLNNSALKFLSHTYNDTGIRNVGRDDSIYMPKESITHDFVIINFGGKTANNVKVTTIDGKSFLLPSIAAKSKVTVLGGAIHQLKIGAIGTKDIFNVKITSDFLGGENGIFSRYFENTANNTLKITKNYEVVLNLPTIINELKTTQAVFYGKDINLESVINNISSKTIKANLKFELETNLGNQVIKQTFSSLSELQGSTKLAGAVIHVDGEENLFSTISFKMKIFANNDVLVGENNFTGTQIVRAPYTEITGAPVIVFSSDINDSRAEFKDLMSELGGMDKISILDLNGESDNIRTLNERMNGKTIYIIQKENDQVISKINGLFRQKNLVVLFYNKETTFLNSLKTQVENLKDSTMTNLSLADEKITVMSTVVMSKENIKDKVSTTVVNHQTLDKLNVLVALLKLTDDELIANVTSQFDPDQFLNKEEKQRTRAKVLELRSLEDVKAINEIYKFADGRSERIHTRRMFKKLDDLIINKFKKVLEEGEANNKIAASFYAFPLEHCLEQIFDSDDSLENKIEKKAIRAIKDFDRIARKNIKKNNQKDLVEKILAVESEFFL